MSYRVLSWFPKTPLKKCWREDKDLKSLHNVIRENYPCQRRFWGLPCFSCMKCHIFSQPGYIRLVVHEISFPRQFFFLFLSMCFSWCVFELAASLPLNLSFPCCFCSFKKTPLIITFQYQMAFKSLKRNSDTQQHGRDLWGLSKYEWWSDFLCFLLFVLTIYTLPYYAVTKPNHIMTYASLASPPYASWLWLS